MELYTVFSDPVELYTVFSCQTTGQEPGQNLAKSPWKSRQVDYWVTKVYENKNQTMKDTRHILLLNVPLRIFDQIVS